MSLNESHKNDPGLIVKKELWQSPKLLYLNLDGTESGPTYHMGYEDAMYVSH